MSDGAGAARPGRARSRAVWLWGAALVALATAARVAWVLAVRTVPVSDFAMYRESANYLSEFGHLDHGFIYMPGFVALLAAIKNLGGDLLAQKIPGIFFGGLGAAGIFVVTWRLVDQRGGAPAVDDDAFGDGRGWGRVCPCPFAATATAIYALWPAGVAMASVVGTDVPASALILAALALLTALGPRRPWAAALAFGVTMGLAAWVRAVALPLAALSFGYFAAAAWGAPVGLTTSGATTRDAAGRGRRARLPTLPWAGLGRALALTGVGLGAALVVLAPWALRHLRQSGALYFTDDHGGITALIGANPNSEGTYTRALNRLFKDVSGRGVLDEPHHATDQAAYAIVREWTRFEPRYMLGLVALKADRLFDPEERLLYWPIFRPGVLVGRHAAWFEAHHAAIAGLADAFGLAVAGLALAGVAVAAARRRWALLALIPFQLALAATYTLFFAEPRYRLPIEMLAFPFVALALGELAALTRAVSRWAVGEISRAARVLAPALLVVLLWRLGWPALLDAGQRLRAHHRWAAIEAAWPRGTRLVFWGPTAPFDDTSPIEGAPNGLHLRVGAAGATWARVQVGEGGLPPGAWVLAADVTAEAGGPARLTLGDGAVDVPGGATVSFTAPLGGGGGEMAAGLTGPAGTSIWIENARLLPTSR